MAKNFHTKQSGFTLVEMLVVIFIAGIVSYLVINFQINIFSLNKTSTDSMNAQTDARNTLKTMSAEIRSMSAANDGSYAISLASTSSLIFFDDIDNDTIKERIRYFMSGSTLKKGVIEPTGSPLTYNTANEKTSTLVNDVANGSTPIFYYYDKNYDGTSAPLATPINIPQVRLIKVYVVIDKDSKRPPAPIVVTTQISIRNLKDNL